MLVDFGISANLCTDLGLVDGLTGPLGDTIYKLQPLY